MVQLLKKICSISSNPRVAHTYKAVQLRHWGFVAWVADVPHLHAAFAPSVNMTRRVTDGDGAHHISVAQRIDLSSVAWDARADQCIGRKRHRLHLSIGAHVKGVRSEERVVIKKNNAKR